MYGAMSAGDALNEDINLGINKKADADNESTGTAIEHYGDCACRYFHTVFPAFLIYLDRVPFRQPGNHSPLKLAGIIEAGKA